jgi:single-strand DNA-binding protein
MVQGESVFLDVRCWRGMARNAAAALTTGSPVIVQGRLRARSYVVDGPEGPAKRSTTELEAIAVGLDLARLPVSGAQPDGLLPQPDGAAPEVAA